MTSQSTGKTRKHSLPKSQILRGYRIFGQVLSRGTYVQSDTIRCYFDMQREIPPYQCTVGFAVRKPGSAVRRNRLRRILRETYRQRHNALNALCAEQKINVRCVFLADAGRIPDPPSFAAIDSAVGQILDGLMKRLKES